jgi:hypothetical protein
VRKKKVTKEKADGKLVLNPSRLKDYAACKFRYYTKYIKGLTSPFRVAAARELGSFVHAGEAAEDEGRPMRAAIKRELKRFKLSGGYQSADASTLMQLMEEAEQIVEGGIWVDGKGRRSSSESYKDWKRVNFRLKHPAQYGEVMEVEKRFFTDIGPLILAPKLDMILSTSMWVGQKVEHWAVEKKTTTKWAAEGEAQVNWKRKWVMDIQTTIQLVVLEEEGYETAGCMVQPIVYSRQNCKGKKDPQPIGKVNRPPLVWTRKPAAVMAHFRAWMEDLPKEILQRTRSNYWPTDGMANGSCDFCGLAAYCRNEGNLVRREPDEVDEYKRKRGWE